MNDSTLNWAARLVAEIVDNGRIGTPAPEQLDRLLAWLAGRESPSADLITAEFAARSLGGEEARRLALSALDDYLFADEVGNPLSALGLAAGTDRKTVKSRYRRLMQVYHPDRAVAQGDWLTSRAEMINRAWSRFSRNGGEQPRANVRPPAPPPPRPTYTAGSQKAGYPPQRDRFHLRKSLGSPQQFQREVLIALVVLSVVVLGLIYLSSRDGHVPSPRVDDKARAEETAPKDDAGRREAERFSAWDEALPVVRSGQAADETEEALGGESPLEQVSAPASDDNEGPQGGGAEKGNREATAPSGVSEQPEEQQPATAVTGERGQAERETARTASEQKRTAGEAGQTIGAEQQDVAAKQVSGKQAAAVQEQRKTKREPERVAGSRQAAPTKPASPPASVRKPAPAPPKKMADRNSAQLSSDNAGMETSSSSEKRAIPDPQTMLTGRVPGARKEPQGPVVREVDVKRKVKTPERPRPSTKVERFVAKRALVRYVDGIVKGDVDKISYTVGPRVEVAGVAKSRSQVVSEFKDLFRNTTKRKYNFAIKSWRYLGNDLIEIVGTADIRYRYKNSPAKSYKGKLVYYFVKKGLDAKLVRIVQE